MINQLSKDITLDNCLELFEFADHHIIDELKINCLKFIMLNMVSFFSESKLSENLTQLPIYLIRDISNFLKVKDIQKFLWVDMVYFEQIYDYTIEDDTAKEMRENALTRSNCLKKFS